MPATQAASGRAIARLLSRHGYRLVAAPESFLIDKHTTLVDGEPARARSWGTALGTAASSADLCRGRSGYRLISRNLVAVQPVRHHDDEPAAQLIAGARVGLETRTDRGGRRVRAPRRA